MSVQITVNPDYVGEIYLPSIAQVLRVGTSVIVEDSIVSNNDIRKALEKKIIIVSSPTDATSSPDSEFDPTALNPNEKFKIKDKTNRNFSVQGIAEMITPSGVIYIDYQTLVSGFIQVLLKKDMVSINDMNGIPVVLDPIKGFKKFIEEEVVVAEEEPEVVISSAIEIVDETVPLVRNKISLKSAEDVKAATSIKTENQVKTEIADHKKKHNMKKDFMNDDVIDPIADEAKHTTYVWDAHKQEAEQGKPVFKTSDESIVNAEVDREKVSVIAPRKLSIKTKNDVLDAVNTRKKVSVKTSNIVEEVELEEVAEIEEAKPVVKKKTTKKSSKKKTAKKASTKKKTTKKSTKKKRTLAKKDGIDKVIANIQKKKKLGIKAVGSKRTETKSDDVVIDDIIIHNSENMFVDQIEEAARLAKHPILSNKMRRNNEEIE